METVSKPAGQEGGIATAPTAATSARTNLTDGRFRQLQELRRGNTGSGDGYLSLMLVNRAGWTTAMAADFLGLDVDSVNQWQEAFARGTEPGALEDLPAPRLAR